MWTDENCDMIFERIERQFEKENKNRDCWVEYEVTEIIDFPEDSDRGIQFKKSSAW